MISLWMSPTAISFTREKPLLLLLTAVSTEILEFIVSKIWFLLASTIY